MAKEIIISLTDAELALVEEMHRHYDGESPLTLEGFIKRLVVDNVVQFTEDPCESFAFNAKLPLKQEFCDKHGLDKSYQKF